MLTQGQRERDVAKAGNADQIKTEQGPASVPSRDCIAMRDATIQQAAKSDVRVGLQKTLYKITKSQLFSKMSENSRSI